MKKIYLFFAFISISILTILESNAQLTPQDAIVKMTRGINIGNTLDATPTETSWGNPAIEEKYFDAYKNAGFTCVRIPITWNDHVATSSPYTINSDWLNRVEQVVDWGLGRGLFIVINAHHEDWVKKNPSPSNLERFDSIWSQISTHFKDKSDHLLFEMINEPYPMPKTTVDSLNERVLSIIRKTNPTRIVLFSGYMWANSDELIGAKIPNDPYLIGYFHSYDPYQFGLNGVGTWGTDADKNAVKSKYNTVSNWSTAHKIPVFLGEFGATKKCDYDSRLVYYEAVVREALNHKFAFAVWDDGGDFKMMGRSDTSWNELKDIVINTKADPVIAIQKTEINNSVIFAYPNPAYDFIKIQVPEEGKLSIFNISGKLIKNCSVKNRSEVSVKELAAGIYFLQLSLVNGSTYQEKITIQK